MIFCTGIGLLVYPTVANWWNSFHATQATVAYNEIIESLDSHQYDEVLEKAYQYNRDLITNPGRFSPSKQEHENYMDQLSVGGTTVIGSIRIPTIRVDLPIYHGTDDTVLAIGAGHMEGSSLPVGGKGTHAVITGHRGLPSAELFTRLDEVVEGDVVILNVLREKYTYQIDTIRIVEPEEISQLKIDPEKDQITLVTCTPYGVNTHRMLLTGHRVENEIDPYDGNSDMKQIRPAQVALFIAVPLIIVAFGYLVWGSRRKNEEEDEHEDEEDQD